ncbi:MAG: hypothetical protein E7213_02760 [Clostridium sp.]|nr:hypothetical protein [Clostridium sp.]
MREELFEKAKREINLLNYISSTCAVKVSGSNGKWNINSNPIDLQTEDNFKVSLKNGVWLYNSFNSDEGGTIIDFLKEKENLSNEQIIDKLNDLLGNTDLLEKPQIHKDRVHKQKDINKLFDRVDTRKVDYFRKRGFSEDVIKAYKLGTAENGIADMYSDLGMKYHPKMKNHKNIIPCFDEENNLRFLVARNDKQNLIEGDKKTWNIKGIPTYFMNQFYLEGHGLSKDNIILITESWGDSLAAQTVISNNELKVVALHSTSNVKRLGELLTRNRDKLDNVKFIIAFNNDKENVDGHSPGKLATNKTVKILDALNFEYEVFMPEKYNDLNEWLLDNRKEFTETLNKVIYKLKDYAKINISGDVKDALFEWIKDDLRYILNCEDERRYIYWNKKSWVRKTEEESRLLYGKFIKQCENQFKKNRALGKYSPEEASKVLKKIKSWRNTSKVKECLSLIGIDEDLTINQSNYKKKYHIHISANGKIINLRNGEIRDVKKEDMIIDTIPYNLVNKDVAVEFMENRVLNIYMYVLGEERLNFLLDFLAMKLSGKNYQLALINIGPSKSGKSMMKNLTTNLYPDLVSQIPYTYLTTSHRGNMGAERDDVIVNLDKKLIALSSEVEKNDAPIAIGRFKNVLSNSITDARATGGKMQKGIDLTHLDMIIDTNEMPSFSGYDDAIENRLVFINWQNSIPVEQRIDNFNGEVLVPNMDKIWSYFIYRAIELKDKKLIIPEIIKKDSAERKGELDKFTMSIVKNLEYKDGEFIELNELIATLGLFELCPELKKCETIHKTLTDRIKAVPGFEDVIQYRKGKNKVNGIKGITFK